MDTLHQESHPMWTLQGCRSEDKQRLHPESDPTHWQVTALRQLKTESLAQYLEIFPRPVSGHRVRVMKIKGLNRARAQCS